MYLIDIINCFFFFSERKVTFSYLSVEKIFLIHLCEHVCILYFLNSLILFLDRPCMYVNPYAYFKYCKAKKKKFEGLTDTNINFIKQYCLVQSCSNLIGSNIGIIEIRKREIELCFYILLNFILNKYSLFVFSRNS